MAPSTQETLSTQQTFVSWLTIFSWLKKTGLVCLTVTLDSCCSLDDCRIIQVFLLFSINSAVNTHCNRFLLPDLVSLMMLFSSWWSSEDHDESLLLMLQSFFSGSCFSKKHHQSHSFLHHLRLFMISLIFTSVAHNFSKEFPSPKFWFSDTPVILRLLYNNSWRRTAS